MHLDQDMTLIERKTYSCLEWLGDVGGLYDAMRLIGHWLVYPIAFFSLQTKLITQAFGSRQIAQLSKESKSVQPERPSNMSKSSINEFNTGLQSYDID